MPSARLALALAGCALLAAAPPAIVIRHDRDDAAYRQLGDGYPEVCRVGAGMGTLIAPEWVLTAGHVVHGADAGLAVTLGELTVSAREVVLHPSFTEIVEQDGRPALPQQTRDLALVRLAVPVEGIACPRLYRDADEQGLTVRLVGEGRTGDGREGPARRDGVRRGADNVIDEAEGHVLRFRFDAPDDGALEHEGIAGPGDSGGPAFVTRDGVRFLVGVGSGNDGLPECLYGSTETYVRVSAEAAWIDGVLAAAEPQAPPAGFTAADARAPEHVALDADLAPRTWQAVAALTRAIHDEDGAAFEALFVPEVVASRRAAGDPLDGLVRFMASVMARRGSLTGFHELSGQALRLPDSPYPMVSVVFHLEDGTPGYFGVALDDAGRIAELSLFVKQDVCRAGAACDRTAPLAERLGSR